MSVMASIQESEGRLSVDKYIVMVPGGYQCTFSECGQMRNTRNKIRDHLRSTHFKRYICSMADCGYRAARPCLLRQHAQAVHGITHLPELEKKPNLPKVNLSSLSSLWAQLSKNMGSLGANCGQLMFPNINASILAGLATKTTTPLDSSALKEPSFAHSIKEEQNATTFCPVCFLRFVDSTSLHSHFVDKHGYMVATAAVSLQTPRYICCLCTLICPSVDVLQKHLLEQHQGDPAAALMYYDLQQGHIHPYHYHQQDQAAALTGIQPPAASKAGSPPSSTCTQSQQQAVTRCPTPNAEEPLLTVNKCSEEDTKQTCSSPATAPTPASFLWTEESEAKCAEVLVMPSITTTTLPSSRSRRKSRTPRRLDWMDVSQSNEEDQLDTYEGDLEIYEGDLEIYEGDLETYEGDLLRTSEQYGNELPVTVPVLRDGTGDTNDLPDSQLSQRNMSQEKWRVELPNLSLVCAAAAETDMANATCANVCETPASKTSQAHCKIEGPYQNQLLDARYVDEIGKKEGLPVVTDETCEANRVASTHKTLADESIGNCVVQSGPTSPCHDILQKNVDSQDDILESIIEVSRINCLYKNEGNNKPSRRCSLRSPYLCPGKACNSKYYTYGQLGQHVLTVHPELDASVVLRDGQQCATCGVFLHTQSVRQHAKRCRGFSDLQCADCGKVFRGMSGLTNHQRVHTQAPKKKQYSCTHKDCSKKFATAQDLQRHINVHTGSRPHKCPYAGCNKSYKQRPHLLVHFKAAHNIRKIAAQRLVYYKCPYCQKKFEKNHCLTAHIRYNCRKNPNPRTKDPLECLWCSKLFKERKLCTLHMPECNQRMEIEFERKVVPGMGPKDPEEARLELVIAQGQLGDQDEDGSTEVLDDDAMTSEPESMEEDNIYTGNDMQSEEISPEPKVLESTMNGEVNGDQVAHITEQESSQTHILNVLQVRGSGHQSNAIEASSPAAESCQAHQQADCTQLNLMQPSKDASWETELPMVDSGI